MQKHHIEMVPSDQLALNIGNCPQLFLEPQVSPCVDLCVAALVPPQLDPMKDLGTSLPVGRTALRLNTVAAASSPADLVL